MGTWANSGTDFTYKRWASHRSANRYFRHLFALFGSQILNSLAIPLLCVAAISSCFCVYQQALEDGKLPRHFPSLAIKMSEPFNLTSFALSLLLVFRTNSSYSRWLDARKIWGGIVNRSRDLVRQGLTFIHRDEDALQDMLCRWMMAFPKTVMVHVREDGKLDKELEGILFPDELARLRAVEHRPNFVLRVLSEVVAQAEISQLERLRMDENLTFFADAVGACERILKTPIPLSYTRHTSQFLVVWMIFLPFTLWTDLRWSTIPVAVVIAFMLLGIEEIGVQIEEPFGSIALELISDTVERNVREMSSQKDIYGMVQNVRLGAQNSRSPAPLLGGFVDGEIIVPVPSEAVPRLDLL